MPLLHQYNNINLKYVYFATTEAIVQAVGVLQKRCSYKFYKIHRKTTETCNLIKKETLAQVFSFEFCKIFKNTFFYRTPPVAASVAIFIIVLYQIFIKVQFIICLLKIINRQFCKIAQPYKLFTFQYFRFEDSLLGHSHKK